MTRLGHTADVHLRSDADERLEALEAVLTTAADHDVDVVTIGGDLFDRPADVEELRSDLRNRYFSGLDFEVVLIPGNHDVEAFRRDLLFGDGCTVIADEDGYGEWTSADGDLKIGFRPETVELMEPQPGGLTAEAQVVESTGSKRIVYLESAQGEVRVETSRRVGDVEEMETYGLSIDRDELHYFDPETGERLESGRIRPSATKE